MGLRLRGVTKRFGSTEAVAGIDLEVPRHGRLAIVGPSGCGKSTLLNLICGLDEPDEGTIEVLGVTGRGDRLALRLDAAARPAAALAGRARQRRAGPGEPGDAAP